MSNLLISLRATAFTLALTGLAYPLAVTGTAQLLFPRRAHGSLVRDERGQVVGSELIGQRFGRAAYFQPRPSAAGDQGYDPMASGGSNLAPSSRKLRERASSEVARLQKENPRAPGPVPAELVSASASGLDPELSPGAVRWQVARVAQARGLNPDRVSAVVEQQLLGRDLGVLGEPRVNVLLLNLALDRQFGQPAPEGSPLGSR